MSFLLKKKDGRLVLNSYCKECNRKYQEQYRKTHKREYVYRYNKYDGVEK